MTLIAIIISYFVSFVDATRPYIKRGSFYAIITAMVPVVYGLVRWIAFSTNLLTSRNVFGDLMHLCKGYAPGIWNVLMDNPEYGEAVSFLFYMCGGEWLVWSWVSMMVPLIAVAMVLKAIIAIVKFIGSMLG